MRRIMKFKTQSSQYRKVKEIVVQKTAKHKKGKAFAKKKAKTKMLIQRYRKYGDLSGQKAC